MAKVFTILMQLTTDSVVICYSLTSADCDEIGDCGVGFKNQIP